MGQSRIQKRQKKRRKVEKEWRKNKTTENRKRFNAMKIEVMKIKDKAKEIYYTNRIEKCENNQKLLFGLLNEMLSKKSQQVLPDYYTDKDLANLFNRYFLDKIENIRKDLNDKNVDRDEIRNHNTHTNGLF